MLGMLSNRHTVLKHFGKTVYAATYQSNAVFTCHTPGGDVTLKPLTMRFTFTTSVTTLMQPGAILKSSCVICSTRHSVTELVGIPICVYGTDFEMHGRLRRTQCDSILRPYTGSSYLSFSITNMASMRQCRTCDKAKYGRTCTTDCLLVQNQKDPT
jgi:hypothetical protein